MDTAVMQIGSGQSALSLSLLKALGAQSGAQNAIPSGAAAAKPAPAQTAQARSETPQAAPQAASADGSARMQPAAAVGVAPLPPRGSFVDLRA